MSPRFAPLTPQTQIYIAGHRGMVGSALWRHFSDQGFTNLIGHSRGELDLRDAVATGEFFNRARPEVVIAAAARVGGIEANADSPAKFISDNLRIQLNLLDSSVSSGVSRFMFLGSSCIYPKFADQPIREDALMTGPLEPTNAAFATAKIAGIAQVAAIRQQHHLPYISVMPTSLYGPGDNFDLEHGHVLPALIRRFHEAKVTGARVVRCWGTGSPRREFMHVDDFASACRLLLDYYDDDGPINVGTGREVTIAELTELVATVVGYHGKIEWDPTRPDGTPRKLLDCTRLGEFDWAPKISIEDGVRSTYQWFLSHQPVHQAMPS